MVKKKRKMKTTLMKDRKNVKRKKKDSKIEPFRGRTTAQLMKKGKQPPKKGTKLQRNFGVSEAEISRAVDVKHTIDTNKRTKFNEEPKFTK